MYKVGMGDSDMNITEIEYKNLQDITFPYGKELKYMVDEVSGEIDYMYVFKQSFLILKSVEMNEIYRISAYYEINIFTRNGKRHKVIDFHGCTPNTLFLEIAIEKRKDAGKALVIIGRVDQDGVEDTFVRIKEETMDDTGESFLKKGREIIRGLGLSIRTTDMRKTCIPLDVEGTLFNELNGLDFIKPCEIVKKSEHADLIKTIIDMMDRSYESNSEAIGRKVPFFLTDFFFGNGCHAVSDNGKWLRSLFDMHMHSLESNIPGYENCRWIELITRYDDIVPKDGEQQCFLRIFENEEEENPWLYCIESFKGIENIRLFFNGLFISVMDEKRKEDKRFIYLCDSSAHKNFETKLIGELDKRHCKGITWKEYDYVHGTQKFFPLANER